MWVLWWTKWHWGRFPQNISVSQPILIPPNVPYSGAGATAQLVVGVPTGLSLTRPQGIKKNILCFYNVIAGDILLDRQGH
jgi:hypothetical protein